ncbi:hypothetical protein HDU76_005231 [Blyttiomyces sp. JEL0837]|nr:hypothetical protein HDU76_005231 [Blyttiomyces sp. JEL0837]
MAPSTTGTSIKGGIAMVKVFTILSILIAVFAVPIFATPVQLASWMTIGQVTTDIPTSPTGLTLNERVLVISRAGDESPVIDTLQKYNTPYDIVYTDVTGFVTPLPVLSSGQTGLYKLVVMTYLPFWNPSALSSLMTYLSTFNAKLVRINDTPDPALGVTSATGVGYDNGQTMSFADPNFAVSAALSSTSVFSSAGLFHNPAAITNPSLASPVLYFDATSDASGPNFQTIAAALIQNPSGGASFQQLSFYLPFATWSSTSTSLSQVWYSWGMGVNLPATVTPTPTPTLTITSSAIAVPTDVVLNQKVLIISQASQGHEAPVVNTLVKYNVPYEVIYTDTSGFVTPLPVLYSGNNGFYNLVVMTYLPFSNPTALSPLITYLSLFNAKLVRLNDSPDPSLGVDFDVPWTGYDNGQDISFAQASFATSAGLSSNTILSSQGLYHIPSKITNAAIASPVLYFDATTAASGPNHQTIAATLINNPTGGIPFQQLSFYLPFATWSPTSASLNDVWYSWGMGVTLVPSTTVATVASTTVATTTAIPVPTNIVLNERVLVVSLSGSNQEAPVVDTLVKYSTAYDLTYVDASGSLISLPALSSGSTGFYKLIVMTYIPWKASALDSILSYLSIYNAKLVRLNDAPDTSLGIDYAVAWTGYDNGQTMSFAQAQYAIDANLDSSLSLSTSGLFHIPTKITNAAIASPVMYFDASTDPSGPNVQTIAVALIQNSQGGASPFQQMSFYLPFATWSTTSKLLGQVWYAWGMSKSLAVV